MYKKFNLTSKAKELVQNASKSDLISACFWFGINDIQIYKNAFLGNSGASQEFYIQSFVEEYAKLADLYLQKCSDFNNAQNRIYITSIVSTSKTEKDYYPQQGQIVSSVNSFLKDWVESKQDDFVTTNKGTTKDGYWLQYIELNLDNNGEPYQDVQSFVSSTDFKDGIHFTRPWFE